MLKSLSSFENKATRAMIAAGFLAAATPAFAQQHAHVHGEVHLDVAVDTRSITLAIDSPLDSFLGFERAPRTDAERKQVADMEARLRAADTLFKLDPAGECKLSKVDIVSPVLGLGAGKEHAQERKHGHEQKHARKHEDEHKHDHDHDHKHDHQHGEGEDAHADIGVNMVFACAKPESVRFIDVPLFDVFKRARVIQAQVAAPQGQFKRTLRPGESRLSFAR